MTATKAFQKLKGYVPLDWEETKLVESALNRLEKIENTSPSVLREDISKKLKAIEIIKEKRVDCFILPFQKSVKEYNFYSCNYAPLTETEFSLLKEVLK